MTVLLAIIVGALVAGLTVRALMQPHIDTQRLLALSRLQAALGPSRERPGPCPICVAPHRFKGSECEEEMTSR